MSDVPERLRDYRINSTNIKHKMNLWDSTADYVEKIESEKNELKSQIKKLKSVIEYNRIPLLQYASLRNKFQKMTDDILGRNYYNMGMDVYECDQNCCEDITYKANKTILKKIMEIFW
jgi:hypothetical protein